MREYAQRRARHGLLVYQLVLLLILLVIIIILIVHFAHVAQMPARQGAMRQSSGALASAGVFSLVGAKPQPTEITFHGCPPSGDGGDPALNRLKNRVDSASYIPVPFDSLERLPWPRDVERRHHTAWSASESTAVARYEGTPVTVEGYLAAAKREGPESTNCHGADAEFRDWHIWMVDTRTKDRAHSVVVEVTPRVRAIHPAWALGQLTRAARAHTPVRISGWLLLDPEHPEQLGKTRGTLWEIHPITRIEVQRRGRWVVLDSLAPTSRTTRDAKGHSASRTALD
ncbi:MAG TPA: hypothetical protein VFW98_13240 [Gemmatimonadaceae bacterium]|nr:hypothetical protein [Gemmatimonadaceae bacterium]